MTSTADPVTPEIPDVGDVEVDGPWRHRSVSANGAQFHVAEAGDADAPLVLLLHGFPEFWWAWRHQLPALAETGWRAAAMDLRGYGGSDKPPDGYDPNTLSADITGVIRSLGARDAVVVGHDWGGFGAWAAAALRPAHVRAIGVLSMPHPLIIRRYLRIGRWRRIGSTFLNTQIPMVPERRLIASDGAHVETILRRGVADSESSSAFPDARFPDAEAIARYQAAMRLWPAPHCALEYQRWVFRSLFRADGRRFARRVDVRLDIPVLQLHGTADPVVPRELVTDSRDLAIGQHRWVEIDGVGHFPHEEAPHDVTAILVNWLASIPA